MYALIMTFILLLSYIISKQKIEYRKLLIILNCQFKSDKLLMNH